MSLQRIEQGADSSLTEASLASTYDVRRAFRDVMGIRLLVNSSRLDRCGSSGLPRRHTMVFDCLQPGPSWVPIDTATLVTFAASLARSTHCRSTSRHPKTTCASASLEIHQGSPLHRLPPARPLPGNRSRRSGPQGHPCRLMFRPRGLSPPRRLAPLLASTGLLHPVSGLEVRSVSNFPIPIPSCHLGLMSPDYGRLPRMRTTPRRIPLTCSRSVSPRPVAFLTFHSVHRHVLWRCEHLHRSMPKTTSPPKR